MISDIDDADHLMSSTNFDCLSAGRSDDRMSSTNLTVFLPVDLPLLMKVQFAIF